MGAAGLQHHDVVVEADEAVPMADAETSDAMFRAQSHASLLRRLIHCRRGFVEDGKSGSAPTHSIVVIEGKLRGESRTADI